MASHERPAPRERSEKDLARLACLRNLVERGDYFVPADVLARDLLRHLGLAAAADLPQHR